MIRYQIVPVHPEAHLFQIDLWIDQPMPEGQALAMPAWIPGSYMIRDFARHVVRFEAWSDDRPLAVAKLDKHTWVLPPVEGPVQVRIQVYAWDLSVRGAHLDTTHGFFNGTCVFLAPRGLEDQPCEVTILPPEGERYRDWTLATGLERRSGPEWGFGTFHAPDYDALIDHPVEMGHLSRASFEACGVPHHVVLSGRHHADLERLCRDLKPICEYQIRLFGEPAPMDRYLFMTRVTGDGYGGLEHRNSTALMCARSDLPRVTDAPDQVRDGYRSYLGLCSHEYFHTWNVKRIRPAAFVPYDLNQEVHTELLWAFEGITSYYDDLTLVRTGRITPASYLELLGQLLSRVCRGAGASLQTVTESSFDAWIRFYKQDENAANAIVSYYAKGALVALALDLLLRQRTQDRCSLDDLMRLLWQRHGQTGVGVPERGIQALAEEVAGESLDEFFRLALYTTEPLPLEPLLARCGIRWQWRSAAGAADAGGRAATPALHDLGVRLAEDPLGVRLLACHADGAAMRAGLSAGDVIVAIDGLRTTVRQMEEQLAAFPSGQTVTVHAFRQDELMTFELVLEPGPARLVMLELSPAGLTEAGRRWLHQ